MWLLLLGCGGPAPAAEETGLAPSGAWEIGQPVVCDAPLGTAAWMEVALPAWANPAPDDSSEGPEPGVVAWIERPDGLWVAAAASPTGVRVTHVSTGEERTLATIGIVEALSSGDMDGDGTLDLVGGGPDVTVWFSFGEADEQAKRVRRPQSNGAGVHDAVPVDVDGDTDLDLVLVHNGGEDAVLDYALLRNDGAGGFDEEAIEADDAFWGYGFDAVAFDVDQDGDPDLVTCNDRGNQRSPNGLLLNDGGGFAPADDALGLDVRASCMGLAVGDANDDGRLDVFVADAFENILLERTDHGFFDTAVARGLPDFELGTMVWGNTVVDLDNDGRTDLLANLGDFFVADAARNPTAVYRQGADGSFTTEAPFVQDGMGRGAVVADANGDGVVDVLLGQADGVSRYFVSTGCTAGHWLEVEAPAGTEIVVEAGGHTRAALATTEHGMGSTGPSRVHIGLGDVDTVDRVTARLPWSDAPGVLEGPIAADRRVRYVGD
ncbi:MAG: FG-GAP-like repeat-containing protein [Myxococcota bacterium]